MSEQDIALYRKHRPAKWDEVLGQEHVVDVLRSSIEEKNISHAYLFFGTRGTGKTSVARIFAREIGTKPNDMYEIDAASNTGVDDVRELRDAAQVLPLESPYKVYIIDEVHMLSKSASNALLKTLEEPPRHVVFILATTEMHKLPDTVVSRCQSFTFRKPSQKVLKKMIIDVAKKEGFSLDTDAADLIALLGDGSFRDAHGVLQKIISGHKGKTINRDIVEKITGAPSGELINNFIQALADQDTEKGIKAVNQAADQNMDMGIYAKILLKKIRAVLLLRFAPDMKENIKDDFGDDDFEFLKKLAEDKKATINSRTLEELLKAYHALSTSYVSTIPFELAIVALSSHDKE